MTGRLGAGVARLHDLLAPHVDSRRVPGLVALVARDDDVHFEVLGTPSLTDETPLRRDAIFRIASMTKPITAVTTLVLVDEGRLRLHDPIDDLLTFRMGFGSVMAPPDTFPIQRAEAELGLQSIGGPPWPPGPLDADAWIKALGSLPLMYQPGEQWMYNTGAQVLGVLIARAAGQELGAAMRERVFEPLGMVDTDFFVPDEKLDRLTTFYAPDAETDALHVLDAPADSWWSRPPLRPDASGWLVSTIDDYWRFASMVRAGGTLGGVRILSPDWVARMTSDHVPAAQRADMEVFLPDGASWGLGLEVPARGSEARPLPCGYGWDGGSGTAWRTNAHHGVTGILLTQRAMTSPEPPRVFDDFWVGVNAAAGI